MHFSAEFFDGKSSRAKRGVLKCTEGLQFSFECSGEVRNLVGISWTQTNSRLLITSENLGKYSYIAIADINDQLQILKLLAATKNQKQKWYTHFLIAYYTIVGLFVLLWIFMESFLFLLPVNIEPWLEKQARLIHFHNSEVIANDSNNPTLLKIKKALVEIDPALKEIEIEVVRSNEINAVTLPNKKIVIYSKLIENANSIEELMGIIAHEMTHVKFRHCIASYIKLSLINAIDTIIFGGAISNTGIVMYFLQSSRAHEMQADEGAIKYLDKLHLSTNGISNFFKKIDNTKGSWSVEFLRTHPASYDRKELFNKHRKIYRKSKFNQEDLKKIKFFVKNANRRVFHSKD